MKPWEISTAIAEIGFGVALALYFVGVVARVTIDSIFRDQHERLKAFKKWAREELKGGD